MKTIQEYLKAQLYQDLCYACNDVNENGGLYDGQIELASFLVNDIETRRENKTLYIEYDSNDFHFKNIFFNKLILEVRFWNRNSVRGYSDIFILPDEKDIFKKYNYDINNEKLIQIKIELDCPNDFIKCYNDIRGRISHELNHCYTYYEIIKDDFKEPEKIPEEYHNKLHIWRDNIYSKISTNIENPSFDESEYISYCLIYTLTRYERNAFLSEILSYLFDKDSSFSQAIEIQNKLEKSHQYNLYAKEGPEILDIIKNKWNKEQQNVFVDTYNKVYGCSKTFGKIMKILDKKLEDTIKKINKNVSRLCNIYINRNINENNKGKFFDPSYDEISFLHNPYYIEFF